MGRSKSLRDPTPATHRLGLLALILLALALRLPGLSWGLPPPGFFFGKPADGQDLPAPGTDHRQAALAVFGPEPTPPAAHIYSYHPDEVFLVRAAAQIALTGDLNPYFFNYGSLYIYLLAPLLRPLVTGHSPPVVSEVEPLGTAILPIATAHLLARFLTLAFSLATIFLTYQIARKLYSHNLALLGAGLLAVAPLHALHSHFATVDVPLTFFTTLTLAFSLSAFRSPPGCHSERSEESRGSEGVGGIRHSERSEESRGLQDSMTAEILPPSKPRLTRHHKADLSPRLNYLLLAAAASGAAASVKYSGASSLLLPLALLLFPNKAFPLTRRLAFTFAILAVASLAFVTTCPFSLLSPHEFLADIRFELSHLARGGTIAFTDTPPAPLYHLTNSLPHALGPLFLLSSLIGLVLALRRPQREEWPLLLWTILSFATASLSQEKFIRYTLPTLPCLTLLAARLAHIKTQPWRGAAFALLSASALSAMLICVAHLRYLILPDARSQTAEWVLERVPRGAPIGLPEFPWFFTPPITPHNGGEKLSREDFSAWNLTSPNPVLIAEWPVLSGVEGPPSSKNYWAQEAFAQNPPPFILVSDIEVKHRLRTSDPKAEQFWAFLHSDYRLVATFGSKPSIFSLPLVGRYPPPDWEYHDPIVWIFERRR